MSLEVKREFVFSTFVRSSQSQDDMLVIKEKLHMPNGDIKPNLRTVKNYERPFFVVKPEYQDYEDKKEYEPIDKLNVFHSTQSGLSRAVARALGKPTNGFIRMSDLKGSPFVYGLDISTNSIIADAYKKKHPDLMTNSTLAIMDYETNVLGGKECIIAGAVTMKTKVHLAFTRDYLNGKDEELKETCQKMLTKYLDKIVKDREIVMDVTICDTPAEVVIALMRSTHAWMPDFLGFWNMTFDIGKMLDALVDANIPPELIFSDPKISEEFKFFDYKQQPLIKVKADGTSVSRHMADLWHVITAPSSFYCVDLMCYYKINRVAKQMMTSYALDAVLGKELNISKLKFKEADGLTSLEWHIKMQAEYKFEYLIYCVFDCVSVEMLDESTGDIARSIRPAIGISELGRFSSNPKRLIDQIHFNLKADGKVIATTSSDMTEELDKTTFDKTGYICTLASELQYNMGVKLLNDHPTVRTRIVTQGFDLDLEAGYPTIGSGLNISKGTSEMEVFGCDDENINEEEIRQMGINITNGTTNCTDIATRFLGFPTHEDLLADFKLTRMAA